MKFCRQYIGVSFVDNIFVIFVDSICVSRVDNICVNFIDCPHIPTSGGGDGAAFTEPVVGAGRSRAFRLSRELVRRVSVPNTSTSYSSRIHNTTNIYDNRHTIQDKTELYLTEKSFYI